jgi:hypothetical protein
VADHQTRRRQQNRFVVNCAWWDVPHLPLADPYSILSQERAARCEGLPMALSAALTKKLQPLIERMSPDGRAQLARKLRDNVARSDPYRRLFSYYPDNGPLRRVLYPRHM